MRSKIFFVGLAFIILANGCQQNSPSLKPEEAKEIAKEAFLFGFPLVMNYKTLYANAIDKNSGDYKGEFNQKSCDARLFTPEDKAIVTPNSDTPYCMFWSDIRQEPVVFSVPAIDSARYYSFQLIDMFTHNFFYIGSLTTGNQSGNYLIALEGWNGKVPEGITKVVRSETDLFFTIVRTQLFNSDDLDNVAKLQSEYKVQTLSEYNGEAPTTKEAIGEFPKWTEGSQYTEESFKYLDAVLKFVNPIEKEIPVLERFKKLGIGTKEGFDISRFDAEAQQAIKEGVKEGFAEMEAFIKANSTDPLGSTKIFGTRDFLEQSAKKNYGFDNAHLIRAVGAYLGIYGNSAGEATYPMYLTDGEGQPLDASKNKYTLTFDSGQVPPVRAFWSLTMYDGKTQLLVDNKLDKYLVNSTSMSDLVKNRDGSITIFIQKESPGKNLEPNWLPAPDGPFYCVMRLYGPEESVLQGAWKNPPMIKSN